MLHRLTLAVSLAALLTAIAAAGSPATPPEARVDVSPSHVNFGQVALGSGLHAQAFTVTNTGTVQVDADGIDVVKGQHSEDFDITNECSITSLLAPGQSCNIWVDLWPNSTGAQHLNLTYSEPGINAFHISTNAFVY